MDGENVLFTKTNTNSKIKLDALEENKLLREEVIFLRNQIESIYIQCQKSNSSKIRQK